MKLPLQITWREVEHSDAIEAAIREHADKLDQFSEQIMSCRVVVEAPHGHHHKGNLYHIGLDLTLPGKEIAVKRDPAEHAAHEDIYVTIRDAFDAARRQIQDYVRKQRGDVKVHDVPTHGRVIRKFPAQDYGIITAPDGHEVYFHRNALIDVDFDMLHVGTEVYYVEEEGKEGPNARQVTIGKHDVGAT